MAPALILLIFSGLYSAINSKQISERARREKWPFGGSRVFVLVSGLFYAGIAAFLLYTGIERSLDSDSPEPGVGWLWLWFVSGALLFIFGTWAIVNSNKTVEYFQSDKSPKIGFVPFLPLYSRRSVIGLGVYFLAWGVYWMWGGWPF